MPEPLSSGDLENQPAREVGFYGGVRAGWEKARSGLEEVIQHLGTLMKQDSNNVRLQRYISQVEKLLEKTHRLQMRSARVRDKLVEKKPLQWSPSQLPRSKAPLGGRWTMTKGIENE